MKRRDGSNAVSGLAAVVTAGDGASCESIQTITSVVRSVAGAVIGGSIGIALPALSVECRPAGASGIPTHTDAAVSASPFLMDV